MLRTFVLATVFASLMAGSAMAHPHYGWRHHHHCHYHHHHRVCW